uniref:tRNA (carboxymethyluridine(34)-5-O)-methyltransferase n=1 Tax=Lygus hesperus TaxID=30085 RepID=A0A146LKU3_LYGHE
MSRPSSDTKMNRKRAKYSSILQKLYGMSPCSVASENLMICNAGLSLGVNREDLLQTFSLFGKIQSVQMVSKQSHSFVKFLTVENARACFEGCNGKMVLPNMKGPIYLLYLESTPKIVNDEIFKYPPGCRIVENFVNEEEEIELFECVKDSLLDGGEDLKQRKVAHFGYEFLYGKNNIDKDKPLSRGLPQACNMIKDRMVKNGYDLKWMPDQLTVNHYLPGQGIPPHIDTHSAFEDPILSLSLLSDSVMEFRRENKHWSVCLPRRSLLVMSGESRYAWTHGISSRKSDILEDKDGCLSTKERGTRVSFTFRRIRFSPCDCSYEEYCDTRISQSPAPEYQPTDLEQEYVHKVYENIADHFSRTRHKPWPAILDLVKSLEPGSIVLDVGCGNCKYFGFASRTYEIGSDHSFGLLSISRERGFQSVRSNCLSLPFKDSTVDCLLCIAVIHHLSSKDRRIQSVKEMLRVLSSSGQALIYVWAKDQKYQGKASNYLKYQTQHEGNRQDLTGIEKDVSVELPVHVNRTDFSNGQNDVFVPWKLKLESSSDPSSTHLRFYHLFDECELESLCVEAGAHIIKSYYDNGNWCCLISKIPCEVLSV